MAPRDPSSLIQRLLGGVLGCVALLALAGCSALEPIRFERWGVPPLTATDIDALAERAVECEDVLFDRCVTSEGSFLYRRPTIPKGGSGVYMDLADQSCWSGYLLAAMAFQYAALPPDAEARQSTLVRLHRVLDGVERLHDATGVSGLIARCAVPTPVVKWVQHHPETWQLAAHDPAWSCRVDTSKDQYSGYVLGLVAGMQLVDDPRVQQRCAELLLAIARHLDASGLRIEGVDGEVTRFGDMRPRIFGVPIGVHAAILLGVFGGALAALDDEAPEAAVSRQRFEERVAVCLNALEPLHFEIFSIRNYNNDVMVAAGLLAFALSEPPLQQRMVVRAALREFLPEFAGEGNALFVSLAAAWGLRDPRDEDIAVQNLVTAPRSREMRRVAVVPPDAIATRFLRDRKGFPRSNEALPLFARPISSFAWRSEPRLIQRKRRPGNGLEVSSVDWFVAYWSARYVGWIAAPVPGV